MTEEKIETEPRKDYTKNLVISMVALLLFNTGSLIFILTKTGAKQEKTQETIQEIKQETTQEIKQETTQKTKKIKQREFLYMFSNKTNVPASEALNKILKDGWCIKSVHPIMISSPNTGAALIILEKQETD